MATRNVGETNPRQLLEVLVSADATTSATVVIASINAVPYQSFGITNRGSVNIYIEGSYDGAFFHPSIAVTKMVDNVSINSISASTAARFEGPFMAIRVVAQSASGVYRATLTGR
jgi:hypothetical protein